MRTQTIIILFSWLVMLATGTTAHAATFKVSVINRTTGQALIDYPVMVWVKNKGQADSNHKKIRFRTGQDGRFIDTISGLSGKILVAEVNYRGRAYFSAPVPIDNDSGTYRLDVDAFEITNSYGAVHITSRRILLMPRDNKTLEIDDLLQVENTGTKTYVGAFNDALDQNEVLYIPMPKDYMLTAYQAAGDPKINQTGTAIITHKQLLPGKRTISMRYAVRSDTGHFDLTLVRGAHAPKTEKLILYVPTDSPWTIASGSLKNTGSTLLGSTRYTVLQGKPGSVLRLAAASPSARDGFGLLQIGLIAAFIFPLPILLIFRHRLRVHSMRQEHALLDRLQKEFAEETRREELIEYYRPFLKVLRDRSEALAETHEEQ